MATLVEKFSNCRRYFLRFSGFPNFPVRIIVPWSIAEKTEMSNPFFFFLVTLFRVGGFLSVAYLTVANLARLEVSVHC